jgi:uncharacterized protein (DUF2236 family)
VAEHSSFRRGALDPVLRLHHTVRSMLSLTFGDKTHQNATLARINALHKTINGTLKETAGPFRPGARYSAEDPALVLWVHATLLESIPLAYERLVGPLTEAERDRYCDEAASTATALGVVDRPIPRTAAATAAYMDAMYAGGEIVVSETARTLAHKVLRPPLWWMVWPAARVNTLLTIGSLPRQIREQYGFAWTASNERALDRWTRVIRRLRRVTPDAVALWSEAR